MGNGNSSNASMKNPLIDQWMKAVEKIDGKPALRFMAGTATVIVVADTEAALRDFCYMFPMPMQTTVN